MSEILMDCPPLFCYSVLKFYIINFILTKFDYIFIIRYLIHDEKHFHYNLKFYRFNYKKITAYPLFICELSVMIALQRPTIAETKSQLSSALKSLTTVL